jgi:hypothetical protein
VDLWEYCSTKSIAVRRDFYTSVADGKESDRIEKWLADEIETPAQAVLDKLTSRTPLTPQDRKKLARYIASLDARSPVYYRQHTEMMADLVPEVLDEVGKTIREAAEKRQRLPDVPETYARSHSIYVELDRGEPGANNASVNVNVIVGREFWLESLTYIVEKLSVLLESHDWRVVRPHDGWTWYTSDHPVLRLHCTESGEYHFGGGFGSPGDEVILPLSPTDLLYAQVGQPARLEQFSLDQTYLIKRFIAEHAHRWIVAARPVRHATWFRPRVVDLAKYGKEEAGWQRFHPEQSRAVLELRRKDDESVDRAS